MTRDEWLRAFSAQLGQPMPSAVELDTLAGLAVRVETAADTLSAFVACWMAGRSDRTLPSVLAIADLIAVWGED